MRAITALSALYLLLACTVSHAETPAQIRQVYAGESVAQQPGFAPSAKRGEQLFRQSFKQNDKMPPCTSCHTERATEAGQHVVTGKPIRALAVSANAERFTDPAKVEKWFGRNCKEVLGRPCAPAEKADFVAFMSEVR